MVQTIDVILAWLIAEDDGAKKKVVALLADRDEDLSLVRGTLQGKFQPYPAVHKANWYRTTRRPRRGRTRPEGFQGYAQHLAAVLVIRLECGQQCNILINKISAC